VPAMDASWLGMHAFDSVMVHGGAGPVISRVVSVTSPARISSPYPRDDDALSYFCNAPKSVLAFEFLLLLCKD
jgi:hypothetical protein